ncbi:MAG: DMT family transporter [Clostridiales bacterium]|nr:DMT family transporter [Clostridiales bacterium]
MSRKGKAVCYIICSAFCFTWMNIFVRLSGDLPSIEKSFFRNFIAMLMAAVMILRSGEGFHLNPKNLPWFVCRAAFGTLGILCNFYAVDHLVLANASMLNKMSPFFVLVFSYLILKEKLTPFQAGAVAVAFCGSLFIVKPNLSNLDLVPSMIGLLGGLGAGIALTFVRMLGLKGERGTMIVLFFSAFSCLCVLPWMIFNFQPMTGVQLAYLIMAGVAAAGGQFSITAAYTHAPGREVSVYDYSQIIFSAVFGYFLFGDVPDGWSFLGYVLIIGAAVSIFFYDNRPQHDLKGREA